MAPITVPMIHLVSLLTLLLYSGRACMPRLAGSPAIRNVGGWLGCGGLVGISRLPRAARVEQASPVSSLRGEKAP